MLLTLLANSVLAGAAAFLFATVVITIVGEIVPQAWFRAMPWPWPRVWRRCCASTTCFVALGLALGPIAGCLDHTRGHPMAAQGELLPILEHHTRASGQN
ncbi:MAG: hypothetical protein Q8K74_09645 [Candidatus Nitrotoga sp.]|nr:hypothetical protein [Candidatus Nitrotoga sp.]